MEEKGVKDAAWGSGGERYPSLRQTYQRGWGGVNHAFSLGPVHIFRVFSLFQALFPKACLHIVFNPHLSFQAELREGCNLPEVTQLEKWSGQDLRKGVLDTRAVRPHCPFSSPALEETLICLHPR